jgi:hypothetical protein
VCVMATVWPLADCSVRRVSCGILKPINGSARNWRAAWLIRPVKPVPTKRLRKWPPSGGSPVSDGCIHQHVQGLGGAAQLQLPTPKAPLTEPEFSLVMMIDGWMAREGGSDWGAQAGKKPVERSNRWANYCTVAAVRSGVGRGSPICSDSVCSSRTRTIPSLGIGNYRQFQGCTGGLTRDSSSLDRPVDLWFCHATIHKGDQCHACAPSMPTNRTGCCPLSI